MRRARVAAVLVAMVAGCAADAVLPPVTTDMSVREAPDADGALPAVDAGKPDCPRPLVQGGRACVPAGWFLMPRFTTVWWPAKRDPPLDELRPEKQQPVFAEAFWIDKHEVTNGEWAEFVSSGKGAPRPTECGFLSYKDSLPEDGTVMETSGWADGRPSPESVNRPVVCVTRAEALEYCSWRGGRLPSVAEWFAAGRGPYPDSRRFPWGDAPPGLESWSSSADWAGRAVVGAITTSALDVGVDAAGASPRGVLGLAGNVSELLAECAEQLSSVYPSQPFLIRPFATPSTRCRESILLGGTNWRSELYYDSLGAQTVYKADGIWIQYVNPEGRRSAWSARDTSESYRAPGFPALDAAGNDRAGWRIGFRCAYDVK